MGSILNGLMELQAIENRLRSAKNKLLRCKKKIIAQENQLRSLQSALAAKKEEIQLTKIQSDRLELELQTRDESISKLRASLNTAKTNKEYAAVLTQLNTTKADNSKIETQVLELMRGLEEDNAEYEKIQGQIEEQKRVLEGVQQESEILAKEYQSEIAEVQQQWNQKAQEIPAEQLEIFRRVAETYDGEALAIIEKQGDKTTGYSCGGCFMGITVESVNLLMTRDDVIRCPNCTRILVLSDSQD